MTSPTKLTAMMGSYKKTAALKEHRVASPLLELDFAPVEAAQKAFKDVVRNHSFDVAELAIMTFLQGLQAGAPYVLVPFVMNGGFHHKSILCRSDASLAPQELPGKRVAMRAYSQTTPAWVRGILSEDYGVPVREVHWLGQEGAHVANYEEPPWVSRLESGLDLDQLLLAGEVDAIISGGARADDARIRTLIPDAAAAALAWHRRTGVVPINHIIAVRTELAQSRHDLVRELYRMLGESRASGGDLPVGAGPDLQPSGFDALRPALEMAIRFAFDQKLVQTAFSVEQLYGGVAAALA